jgi:RHS repeat-associated protein
VQISAHDFQQVRVQVGHIPYYSATEPYREFFVYSDPVQLTGATWDGELSVEMSGPVNPVTGKAALGVDVSEDLPSGDWVAIFSPGGARVGGCYGNHWPCVVQVVVPETAEGALFTVAVVSPAYRAYEWPADGSVPAWAVKSRTLRVANPGWVGELALTASTGLRGVVDATDPVVGVTASLSAPMATGYKLLVCDQSARPVFEKPAGNAAWTDASFEWTVPSETLGVLTATVVAAAGSCSSPGPVRAERALSVEHIGFGGEVAIEGSQPSAQDPRARLLALLSSPLGVGYMVAVTDLTSGRVVYYCAASSSRSDCLDRLAFEVPAQVVKPHESRQYRADVYRLPGEGGQGRVWSSDALTASHPGWTGDVALSARDSVVYNSDPAEVTVVLSEPPGDARLIVCNSFEDQRGVYASRFACRGTRPTADPTVFTASTTLGHNWAGNFRAYVYYPDNPSQGAPTEAPVGAEAASSPVAVSNGGWRGTVSAGVQHHPVGEPMYAADKGGYVWAESVWMVASPSAGDQTKAARYRRVIVGVVGHQNGPIWTCNGYSQLNCMDNGAEGAVTWGRPDGMFQGQVRADYRETYGFPDGEIVGTSGWVSLPQGMVEDEYRCGANPSVDDSVRCHGDPVSSASGEWWDTSEDLVMDGPGPSLGWVRSFSTFDRAYQGVLGPGWRPSWDMRLEIAPAAAASSETTLQDASKLRVVQENGSVAEFTRGTDGRYGAPARIRADLAQTPEGGFVFTRRDTQEFVFDQTGRLTAIRDQHGSAVTLDYTESGALAGAHDGKGRYIRLTYSGAAVTKTADQSGREVSYAYDANGRLVAATGWDGTTTRYAYDAEGRVRQVTGPAGGTYTNAYDQNDRVTTQTAPDGGKTSFAYDDGRERTEITHPDGTKTLEEYNNHRLVKVTEAYGTAEASATTYAYRDLIPSQISAEFDQAGNSIRYTYDQNGHVLTTTDPTGRRTQAFYSQAGHLTKTVDPAGASTLTTLDAKGNPVSVTDPAGKTTALAPNPDGTVASITGPTGGTTRLAYNQYGYPIGETTPEGLTTQMATDSLGRVTQEIDSAGLTARYTYDAYGFLTKATGPDGLSATYSYHPSGLLKAATDTVGQTTSYAYDTLGRVIRIAGPTGAVTTYTYDLMGRVAAEKTTAPGVPEAVTTYGYDRLGQLTRVTDPLGRITKYAYDQAGNQTTATSPLGLATSWTYDQAGRVLTETTPGGKTTVYGYDQAGRLTSTTGPEGRYVNWTYTKTGLVSRQAAGQDGMEAAATEYSYDPDGRLAAFRDADGRNWSAAYDLDGRPVAQASPAAGQTTFAYDQAGRLAATTNAGGATTTYTYDQLGRPSGVSYSDGTPDVAYAYDEHSRLAGVSDGTAYAYDPYGRTSQVVTPEGRVAYAYDALGRVTAITYPDGRSVAYRFDAAGQLTRVTDLEGGVYAYGYDADGRATSLAYPNCVVAAYTYTPDSEVSRVRTTGPSGGIVLDLEYTYTDAGLLDAATRDAASPIGYTWDGAGHLGGTAAPGQPSSPMGHTPAGAPTSLETGMSLAYDQATGRLAASAPAAGPATAYLYDSAGNRTQEATPASANGGGDAGVSVQTFSWDAAGNLVQATLPDGTSVAYTYDSAGLLQTRQETRGGGQAPSQGGYVWDTGREIPALLGDGERWYVYGAGSVPLGQLPHEDDVSGGGTPGGAGTPAVEVYLHGDLTGSIRAATNPEGEPVAGADYTAYGEPLTAPGLPPVASITRFGYAGELADPATGLVYLRARWLDPETAQFLSADPAGWETGQGYTYTAGNPLQLVDPLGLFSWSAVGDWLIKAGQTTTNFLYGAIDNLTFGTASMIANAAGWDSDWFDSCSSAFKAGQTAATVAELVIAVAVTGGAAVGVVVAKIAAKQGLKAAFKTVARQAGHQAAKAGSRAAKAVRSKLDNLKTALKKDDGFLDLGASVGKQGKGGATNGVAPRITSPYSRPSGATTRAQREAVQGKPCVDCGNTARRQVADHKDPLVEEYYRTGAIDPDRMRSVDAVQPQCPTCSAQQGARLSRWSSRMRQTLGL